MSYNSKYTGQQVEALLDIVSQGGGTGGEGGEVQKTTEAEILAMGFTKNQGTITEVKMNGVSKGTSGVVDLGTVITEHQDISSKVDKVTGKQLSTEDFTTALKQKLEGLSNYNDTEINAAVSSLQTQLNTLVSGNANDAINSFNEIIAFLDGIKDNQDLSSIIASIEQQIASKMDKVTLASVATSGSYNDLKDKPTIPTKVGQLENDEEYSTPIHDSDYNTQYIDIVATDFINVASDLDLNTSSETKRVTSSYAVDYNRYGGIRSINESTSYISRKKVNEATSSKAGFMTATDKAKLDSIDMSTKQDKLVSGTNIKTINGQSILGSGNIVISDGSSSGGSGSAEVYTTPFTVEDITSDYVYIELTQEQLDGLEEAASQNKLIAIPFRGDSYGETKGFIVTNYRHDNDNDAWAIEFIFTYFAIEYRVHIYYHSTTLSPSRISKTHFLPKVYEVGTEDGIVTISDDASYSDNVIWSVYGECTELMIYVEPSQLGKTIRFFTGSNCMLNLGHNVYWANGEIPTIEPYTHYELSLVFNTDYGFNAVLTPFKTVE